MLDSLFFGADSLRDEFALHADAPDLIEQLMRLRVRVRRHRRTAGAGHPPGRPGNRKSRPHRENPVFAAMSARMNRLALGEPADHVVAGLMDCVALELHGYDFMNPNAEKAKLAARRARRWLEIDRVRMPDLHLDHAVLGLADLFEARTGLPVSMAIAGPRLIESVAAEKEGEAVSPGLKFIGKVWPFVVGLHEPASPAALRQRWITAVKRRKDASS